MRAQPKRVTRTELLLATTNTRPPSELNLRTHFSVQRNAVEVPRRSLSSNDCAENLWHHDRRELENGQRYRSIPRIPHRDSAEKAAG